MKKIKIREEDYKYSADIDYIVRAFKEEIGAEISREDAKRLWEIYSERMACGWCDPKEYPTLSIVTVLYPYYEVVEVS